jgi:ABC-2 type transport system ATP-binding protein
VERARATPTERSRDEEDPLATPAIRTEALTKHFGEVVALDRIDLAVEQGEVFGFLGPNGAGKSTTIRLLLGLIRPTSGAAWLGGVPVGDVERAHRSVSYVPGDVSLWPQLTGAETLELLGNISGQVDRAFRDELVSRFDLDVSKRARSYSKGNRQKVALIAAFMTRPQIMLLDEPTAGLDPLMEAEFQALAREAARAGQTLFLSSHLLDEVEDLCTRVGILRSGQLVQVTALEELRRFTTTLLEVTLAGPVPDLTGVRGVVDVERAGSTVRVTVSGRPDAVLERLLPAGIVRLDSHAPTLEQIFLTYYETTPEQRDAVAAAHGGGPVRALEGDSQ